MTDEIINEVVTEVIEKAPEPTATADAIIAEELSNNASANVADSDNVGTDNGTTATDSVGFDPLIHEVGPDGKGVRGKNGQWRKKRGRKSRAQATTTEKVEVNREISEECKQMGAVAAHLTFTTCITLLGDDWIPTKDAEKGIDEPRTIAEAYALCFDYYGIKAPEPWMVLAIALTGYMLPRIMLPKTQGRLSRIWQWIRYKTGY